MISVAFWIHIQPSEIEVNRSGEPLFISVSPGTDLDDIISIAVADEEQAMREICRASLQGISINQNIQFLVAPDFYQKDQLVRSIQHGQRVNESLFDYIGNYA